MLSEIPVVVYTIIIYTTTSGTSARCSEMVEPPLRSGLPCIGTGRRFSAVGVSNLLRQGVEVGLGSLVRLVHGRPGDLALEGEDLGEVGLGLGTSRDKVLHLLRLLRRGRIGHQQVHSRAPDLLLLRADGHHDLRLEGGRARTHHLDDLWLEDEPLIRAGGVDGGENERDEREDEKLHGSLLECAKSPKNTECAKGKETANLTSSFPLANLFCY